MTYIKPAILPLDLVPKPFVAGKEAWTNLSLAAWKCAFEHVHYREGIPGPWYIDNAANPEGMWVWDQCFMALYTRYLPDIFPGIQSLDNFYGWQSPDGYISMAYNFPTQEESYGQRINPPLLAWAEWEYYRTTGRQDRIERVLPHLVKFFDWIFTNRKCQDFDLYWFEDAGSSGMDNSPRGRRDPEAGRHMGWVDLTCQLAILALYIGRLAQVVGRQGIADRFHADWSYIAKSVEKWCWCPRTRFYHDRLDRSNWHPSKTVAGFWPLLAEFAPADRVAALCAQLENPATFNRPCPVPSLAYDDPNYRDSGAYWLGGVWPPTNYMVAAGLCKHGRHDLARRLAMRFIDHMAKVFTDYAPCPGSIWEVYSPESAEPAPNDIGEKTISRKDFCGWSGIGPTAMFLEHVLGLETDAPARTLAWRIGLTERHGVTHYPFLDGTVDLVAEARSKPEEPLRGTACATTDLKLDLHVAGRRQTIALQKGRQVALNV